MSWGNTHYKVNYIVTYFWPKKGETCNAKVTQIDETMVLLNCIELLRVIVPIENINQEKYAVAQNDNDQTDTKGKQILVEGDMVDVKIEAIQPGNVVYGSLR